MSKELIIKTYKFTNSQSKTAKQLNISRQRVHQVIKGYKNFGISGRDKKYKLAWKDRCQICFKNPTVALHHKDFNNLNDKPENLISVCKDCHYRLHLSEKAKKLRYYKPKIKSYSRKHKNCFNCKSEENYYAKGLCSKCWHTWYRQRNRG